MKSDSSFLLGFTGPRANLYLLSSVKPGDILIAKRNVQIPISRDYMNFKNFIIPVAWIEEGEILFVIKRIDDFRIQIMDTAKLVVVAHFNNNTFQNSDFEIFEG